MMKKLLIWFVAAKIFGFIYSFFKRIFFDKKIRNKWILMIWGIMTTFPIYMVLWKMGFKYSMVLTVLSSLGLWDSVFQIVINDQDV